MVSPDDALATAVEHLPVGVFALDAAGIVLQWNAEATRITGWGREEVLGRGGTDLAAAIVDTPAAWQLIEQVLAGRTYEGRLPVVVPTGVSVYVRAALAPVPPPRGPIITGVLQDVADSRAGDEAFALLDALWETAPVALAYFDTELRYRRVNGALVELAGGTRDERIGRTLEEVHGSIGAAMEAGLREVLATGATRRDVPLQGRLWHGRGPLQNWLMNQYPVRGADGEILGVGLVVTDMTEAEKTRRELVEAAGQREHALNRYQSLVEATSAAVWIREADGSAAQDSPSLRAITGQSFEEYRGWGFLDAVHPDERASKRAAWLAAVSTGSDFTHINRLRTADGRYRWFRARAVPVRAEGRIVEWVGTETDIDDESRAQHRLAVLAGATFAVNAALDPETELAALADAVVPAFADLCRVYLVDPVTPGGRGVITGQRVVTRVAPGVVPAPPIDERFVFVADHPVARSVRSGTPLLDPGPLSARDDWMSTGEMWEWAKQVELNSTLIAPVLSEGRVVAALRLVACGDRPAYTEDDVALVSELAARASAAVEHGLRFQQTRQVSLALQNSMLTEPPPPAEIGIGGLEVEARYLPATAELEVGGDWYDAFRLPGGDLALAVGDVAGHDLAAAATMGQLRSMLRALAFDSDGDPSYVLRRLDRVASRLDVTRFTTLLYGRVLRAGDRTLFRWSNAGHPPPILVGPDGTPRYIPGGVDVVLGVEPDLPRRDTEIELVPGSTLLLYTDGLVERRSDPDDRGAARLLDLVRLGAGLPLAAFCDHLVRGAVSDTGDDIVVLALRAR
ncbi:SpoIIE family protein phosphatase [Pseudonocardia sp. H11422]|uniref:SpoIIE family protein phosphatase n=1 Tax=Pseudonocardia sp. H11422 TaxID=2835866 RepID=UPI001BDCA078|nr:SpoIIE family protein phosphatase [Pseudonocardia sp. H11422]